MKIILDFDYTLFSTEKYCQSFQKAFEKLRVDKELFQETFEKSRNSKGKYRPANQFELIVKQKPEIDLKKIEREFKKVLNQSEQFLYPDVLFFLKEARINNDLIILSYGEDWFQKEKIKKSKITPFFKEIFITKDIKKTSVLKKLLRDKEKAMFVDDNPMALSENKKLSPKLVTVRINRDEGRYKTDSDNAQIDFSIKNLKELKKILNKVC
jgi:FMN phosphatase YigB (HAD superfamily)